MASVKALILFFILFLIFLFLFVFSRFLNFVVAAADGRRKDEMEVEGGTRRGKEGLGERVRKEVGREGYFEVKV